MGLATRASTVYSELWKRRLAPILAPVHGSSASSPPDGCSPGRRSSWPRSSRSSFISSDQYIFLPDKAHPVAPAREGRRRPRSRRDRRHLLRRRDRPQGDAARAALRRAALRRRPLPGRRDRSARSLERAGEAGERRRDEDVAAGRRRRRAARPRQEGHDRSRTARSSRRSSPGSRRPASSCRPTCIVGDQRHARCTRRPTSSTRWPASRSERSFRFTVLRSGHRGARAADDGGCGGRLRSAASSACCSTRARRSSCRSACRSTRTASVGRRPASRSRSTSCSSSGATSTTATRSPRPERSSSNGQVGPIGGIKQKTIGAREAGVDVFLVPVANAAEARKYAHGLRIVPVKSFQQALHALATLPPER